MSRMVKNSYVVNGDQQDVHEIASTSYSTKVVHHFPKMTSMQHSLWRHIFALVFGFLILSILFQSSYSFYALLQMPLADLLYIQRITLILGYYTDYLGNLLLDQHCTRELPCKHHLIP